MPYNQTADASKMLAFLKKEEALYKKALQHMEQQHVRLQIEELALKSAIRQEQMKIDGEQQKNEVQNEKSNTDVPISNYDQNLSSDIFPSDQSYEFFDQSISNLQNSQAETVHSNITDDRYLEPLILNPNSYGDDDLIEFDD